MTNGASERETSDAAATQEGDAPATQETDRARATEETDGASTQETATRDLRRPLGRVMIGTAALGVVVAVAASVVAWQLLGRVGETTSGSTEVTVSALDALDQTLVLVEELVSSVDTTLDDVQEALGSVNESFATGTDALDTVATLTDEAAPALGSATETLRTLEGVADGIDTALRGFSQIPFAPEYDPDGAFGPTIAQLADDLDPLSAAFRATSDDLEEVTTDTARLRGDIDGLVTSLATVADELEGSESLLSSYREAAAEARALAASTETGVSADLRWARALVVLGGLAFALLQLVPWWVGRGLLAER